MALNKLKQSLEGILNSRITQALMGASMLVCIACGGDKPYGCIEKNNFTRQANGIYTGDVGGRFYAHPTGVMVKSGDYLEVKAKGRVRWHDLTYGTANKREGKTWGLHAGFLEQGKEFEKGGYDQLVFENKLIGANYASKLEFPDSTKMYELVLVIPDGDNSGYCPESYYQDNGGRFKLEIKVNNGSS